MKDLFYTILSNLLGTSLIEIESFVRAPITFLVLFGSFKSNSCTGQVHMAGKEPSSQRFRQRDKRAPKFEGGSVLDPDGRWRGSALRILRKRRRKNISSFGPCSDFS